MNRSRRVLHVAALIAVVSLVSVACDGGDGGGGGESTTTTSEHAPRAAANLTVAATEDATCTDWISNCADSVWGSSMIEYQTMPRVFDFAKENGIWTEVPSPTMADMPSVSDVDGKQTVTYRISPAAVWSDGQPITSKDFEYTWDQIVKSADVYDPTGYDKIERIDTTDPKVAVVTFRDPFASWTQLFGADYGIYPSHLLAGEDRHEAMKDGYDWSGGPWLFEWDRGERVTLTPNPRWYGTKPTIRKVVFRIIPSTASQFRELRRKRIDAISPQAEPAAVATGGRGIPGTQAVFSADTATVEAIWLNNARFPFDSTVVRQAFAYAIDRDAIVERRFGDLGIDQAVQTLNPPIVAAYADQEAWARYTRNLQQVENLMEGDGWTRNRDRIWEKDGKEAAFTLQSTAGNEGREVTQRALRRQLRRAGFEMAVENVPADELFETVLPAGDYEASLYAQTSTSLNPDLCAIACSSNIPSRANDNTGQNLQRIDLPALDALLRTVDTSFDVPARIQASKQADQVMAQEQVSLPLAALPNIAMWSDRLTGPISDNPILSMFWNLHLWSVQR